MRSRAVRLTLSAMVIAALGAAVLFAFNTEQHIAHRRAAALRFEERIRAVDRALTDMRAAQNAYVAAGQSADAWIPKVAGLRGEAAHGIDELHAVATTADAQTSLLEASATVVELGDVDSRVLAYLKSGQDVMAADVVYSEAGQKVTLAANQVDAARALEQQGLDVGERESRRRQLYVLGGAAALSVAMLLLLGAAPTAAPRIDADDARTPAAAPVDDELTFRVRTDAPRHVAPMIKDASEICTEFGRVADQGDLVKVLGRAADLMDASGLVVWMGNPSGSELRPAVAHGYAPQALAKMPAVPKSANNAAAAAYRTGALQIVLARPGTASGALVAPLLTADGPIGALSAEIKGRGETSDATQALAVLFAAQLASVLAPLTIAEAPSADRIASA